MDSSATGLNAAADKAFRTVTIANDPALVVLTTVAEGHPAGCLVGFHVQAGIEPQRYSVWISKANHTYRVSLRAEHFALHFLTRHDIAVAERFGTRSGEDVDKFGGIATSSDEYGVPLLEDCPHRLLLDRIALLDDGGDHICPTAAVRAASSQGRYAPLRVSDVTHLEPGHASHERAVGL